MSNICHICKRETGSPYTLEMTVFEKHYICPDCLINSEHEYAKMARAMEYAKRRKKSK